MIIKLWIEPHKNQHEKKKVSSSLCNERDNPKRKRYEMSESQKDREGSGAVLGALEQQ